MHRSRCLTATPTLLSLCCRSFQQYDAQLKLSKQYKGLMQDLDICVEYIRYEITNYTRYMYINIYHMRTQVRAKSHNSHYVNFLIQYTSHNEHISTSFYENQTLILAIMRSPNYNVGIQVSMWKSSQCPLGDPCRYLVRTENGK